MRVGSVLEELDVCSAGSIRFLCSASASNVSILLCQVSHIPVVSIFKGYYLRQNYYWSQQTVSQPYGVIGKTWNNKNLQE